VAVREQFVVVTGKSHKCGQIRVGSINQIKIGLSERNVKRFYGKHIVYSSCSRAILS
jgi:hypothetical protein